MAGPKGDFDLEQVDTSTTSPNIEAIEDAFNTGNWVLLTGLVLSALIWLARITGLTRRIPGQYDKWVAIAIAMLGSVAAGLVEGKPLLSIVASGIGVGVTAIGVYETTVKPIKKVVGGPKE